MLKNSWMWMRTLSGTPRRKLTWSTKKQQPMTFQLIRWCPSHCANGATSSTNASGLRVKNILSTTIPEEECELSQSPLTHQELCAKHLHQPRLTLSTKSCRSSQGQILLWLFLHRTRPQQQGLP